jgi:PAS domain S-box-containing protein
LAQAAAEAARQELDQYFNSSLDLLCIARTDGTLLRINPAWERVLGYSLKQLQGSNFLDRVHPDDRELTIRAARRLAEGESITDFQNRYTHADGSTRWLEWRSTSDGHGRIFGVARDITERHAFEEAIRVAEQKAVQNRERLLSIAELAHIGHFSADFDTGEVTWTPEFSRVLGLEPDSVLPSLEFGRQFVHPEDIDALDAAIRSVRKDRSSARVHVRVVRPSGEIRQCLATIDHEVQSVGQSRLVGMLQDMTDLKRAEDEQRKLEQQVMQSQKLESLGVLAGGIAHDFNNLLTSILGNADLALRELSPASPACAYLEDIEQVSRRAADLCRQMLAYSGKGRFVVQPVSLNDVVREMAYLLSVSISKKVVIKYNFFPDLPSVLADTTQLRQVVMNLITNASEAIGELSGVVTLTTGVMDCDEAYLSGVVRDADSHAPGQYVYVEVSDTGCGMDAETLDKIFDPFFTTKFTGRGLGLAAVLGIVRGHKGALRVYSEKRHGTTFKILLPAHHQAPQELERANGAVDKWRGRGLVLLADDEESIRSMGRRMLEKAGFEVLTAADGREAVEVFQKHHSTIRIVILDMTMPHLDGEACFREMRRVNPQVKVIMTSGYNEQDVISRFVGKGLAGFVQKPYKSSDLLPKLREVLGE